MYCPNCRNEMTDNGTENVCSYCGTRLSKDSINSGGAPYVNNAGQNQAPAQRDEGSTAGWGVLGFFFPMIGFILWLVWKGDYPKRAKSAGKGALISIIVSVSIGVLVAIITAIGGAAASRAAMLPLLALLA